MSHSGEKMDEKERVCPFLPNIQQKTFCNILSKKGQTQKCINFTAQIARVDAAIHGLS
jgi:hypothetical protein